MKQQIESLKDYIEMCLERGDDITEMNKHLVFYGNPGTGKTTVARIIAGIYKDMGLVSKGHLVEVSREHLVAGYVGQTAIKTSNVIDSALDGILFVDEAYRLADGGENDFGKEAINTLLARMENDRKRLVVIFAGYEKDMNRLFEMNDGLTSRVNSYINFDDYDAGQLKQIFLLSARKKYTITPEVDAVLDESWNTPSDTKAAPTMPTIISATAVLSATFSKRSNSPLPAAAAHQMPQSSSPRTSKGLTCRK